MNNYKKNKSIKWSYFHYFNIYLQIIYKYTNLKIIGDILLINDKYIINNKLYIIKNSSLIFDKFKKYIIKINNSKIELNNYEINNIIKI